MKTGKRVTLELTSPISSPCAKCLPACYCHHRPHHHMHEHARARLAPPWRPTRLPADEIDAVGTKRYDAHSGGEREIQRTMLELLNQLDGFDAMTDVKVCGAAVRGQGGAGG